MMIAIQTWFLSAIMLATVAHQDEAPDVASQIARMLNTDAPGAVKKAAEELESGELSPAERARVLHFMGRGLTLLQRFDESLKRLEESEELANELDNKPLLVRVLQAKSMTYCQKGEYAKGADAARAGIEIANVIRDELFFGVLHTELGSNLWGQSKFNEAIAAYDLALEVSRRTENKRLQAMTLGSLGSIYDELENYTRGTELHRESLQYFKELSDPHLVATTQVNLANSLVAQEELSEAKELFEEALKTSQSIDFTSIEAMAHVGLGDIALYGDDVVTAKKQFELARRCWQKIGDSSGELMLVERKARIEKLEAANNPLSSDALEELEIALETAIDMSRTKQAISLAEQLLDEYRETGSLEDAIEMATLITDLKESIWDEDTKERVASAEGRLKLLEKEKEIQQLNHTNQLQDMEIANQERMRFILIVALCLAVLVLGLTVWLLVARRHAYKSLQHEHAERRRQEQRQIELERKLADQDKTESLRVMAGGIAHDFNNLMTGIVGQAELGKFQPQTSEKDENFEQIIDVAKQASGLTSQLISFVGRTNPVSASVDVVPLIQDSLVFLKSIAYPKADISLQCDLRELHIAGDGTQIRQVLVNLVKNAAESIEKSGHIDITVSHSDVDEAQLADLPYGHLCQPGEFCIIQVRDDGGGMREEVVDKIFDPFFSTKLVGRGLGLASVMGIVRSHRGTIDVHSHVGEGTMIAVYLPLADSNVGATDGKSAANTQLSNSPDETIGVLFVDDDRLVRQSACNILISFGFRVFAAESAEQAFEVFSENKPEINVAVIDYTMTGKSGVWLAKQFRELAPDIKLILCSGYAEENIRETDLFAAFLPKPYMAMDLVNLIHGTVEKEPDPSELA